MGSPSPAYHTNMAPKDFDQAMAEYVRDVVHKSPQPLLWTPDQPLPELWRADAAARKLMPITSGVIDYFTEALARVAFVSLIGNQQHNPGQPLHWSQNKSGDHLDCLQRHIAQRGELDSDGVPHGWKIPWRALAWSQMQAQSEGAPIPIGARA